jgi:hypothetical protein
MASIRHFPATHPLPDWRNFGVMLRVLLGVNLLALAVAWSRRRRPAEWMARYVEMAALVEPLLLLALGLLAALRDVLRRLPLRLGQLAVVLLVGGWLLARASSGSRSVSVTAATRCALCCWRWWRPSCCSAISSCVPAPSRRPRPRHGWRR